MFSCFCFILPVTDGTAEKTGIAYDAYFFLRFAYFRFIVCFQIGCQRFCPEVFGGFKIIALKVFDMLVIPLGKTYQRIINLCQLKHGIPYRKRVHVDQQNLVVLQLDIFSVIIPVNHMVVVRNRLDQRKQLLCRVLGQAALHGGHPVQYRFFDILELSFGSNRAVDFFSNVTNSCTHQSSF